MCVAGVAIGLLLVAEVAYVARLVLCRIHCLERTIVDLNDQQTAALTAVVDRLSAEVREISDFLGQDDPNVAAAIERLNAAADALDALSQSPENPPEPV